MNNARVRRKGQSDVERNGAQAAPTALESRFAAAQPRLGPQRQQLIRAILDNCEETCFLSSREMAKRYEGFTDFSVDLRQHLMTRITPYTALKAATREQRGVADHIDHSLDKALDNLNGWSSKSWLAAGFR